MENKKIGEFLKALRKANGFTQAEIAEQLFISPKTVSKWETGEGIPDISIISSVAELYDVTVDEILRGRRIDIKEDFNDRKVLKTKGKITKRVISKFRVYWYVGIGLGLIGFIVGIILAFTVSIALSLIINGILIVASIIITVMGYINYKEGLKFEDDINIIEAYENAKKSIFLYIFYFSLLILTIIWIIIFICLFGYITDSNTFVQTVLTLIASFVPFIFINRIIKKDEKKAKNKIKADMFLIMMCIMSLLSATCGFFMSYNIVGSTGVLVTGNDIPTIMMWFEQTDDYLFRIFNIIGIGLFMGHSIFVFVKNKYQWSLIISSMLMIVSTILVYFDFHHQDYLGLAFNDVTIMAGFAFIWLPAVIIFYILLLRVLRKNTENIPDVLE